MGLTVGLVDLPELELCDPEGAAWLREDIATINLVLSEQGLPPWSPPGPLPPRQRHDVGGLPYGVLGQLKRAFACVDSDLPLRSGPLDESDEALIIDCPSALDFESHLLQHSPTSGFYVPIELPGGPLFDERLPGEWLGSSAGLLRELLTLTEAFGIERDGELVSWEARAALYARLDGHPQAEALSCWLTLYEAAIDSLRLETLIIFC